MEGRGGEGRGRKREGEQGWSTARTAWKNVVNRGKGAGGGGGGEREGKGGREGGRGRERGEVAAQRSEKKKSVRLAGVWPGSPSVFARAETGAEQTGGERKAHSHCPLRCSRRFHHPANKSHRNTNILFFFLFFFTQEIIRKCSRFQTRRLRSSLRTPSLAADSSPL